jgi:hypothetical protein
MHFTVVNARTAQKYTPGSIKLKKTNLLSAMEFYRVVRYEESHTV